MAKTAVEARSNFGNSGIRASPAKAFLYRFI
jgi:hypothetical protein